MGTNVIVLKSGEYLLDKKGKVRTYKTRAAARSVITKLKLEATVSYEINLFDF